ncbi:hypothetical protein KY289_009303 [Solanum tuberosum]|nr:hypothetical protein KY289_009303 [Solanum tuberosum]
MTLASEQVKMVHVLGDAEAKAVELKTQTKKLENYCEDLASIAKKLKLQKKVLDVRMKLSLEFLLKLSFHYTSMNEDYSYLFHLLELSLFISLSDVVVSSYSTEICRFQVHHLATIDESKSETTFSAPAVCHPGVFVSAGAISGVKRKCR